MKLTVLFFIALLNAANGYLFFRNRIMQTAVRQRMLFKSYAMQTEEEPSVEQQEEPLVENEIINDEEIVNGTLADAQASLNETAAQELVDPRVVALEKELSMQVQNLESKLRADRQQLGKLKDKVSESGKGGFFIVQAKVNDFLKDKDKQQKQRVERNKREFVMKMLPVVDAFRNATTIAPPTTEKEENMHKSFGSLLNSIINVFEKYGYKEYDAVVGDKLDSTAHEIIETVEAEEEGVIVEAYRSGMMDSEGNILRKARVVATAAPASVEEESASEEEETSEEVSEDSSTDDEHSVEEEEAD